MPSISLDAVSLNYPSYFLHEASLRYWLGKLLKKNNATKTPNSCALEHINLSLKKGDRLGVIGHNGAGKTNLLDAIHYLSLCKSYFNPIDSQQIKQGTDFFIINGVFNKNDATETVACGIKRNQKKQFKRNKKDYQRLADHIGLFPLVMVSPYDISIIIEGSEERRKFIDNVISQTDNQYLDELITYNKVLANRNALLKRIADTGRYDPDLLAVFDEQLITSGNLIFEKRAAFMESFTKIFNAHYQFLSDDAERVDLVYESQLLTEDFAVLLKKSTEKDRVLERTTTGIHKDELQFTIHGMPMKKFGSQGPDGAQTGAIQLSLSAEGV